MIENMTLEQVDQRLIELDGEVRSATLEQGVEYVESRTAEKKELLERRVVLFDLQQRKKDALDLQLGKATGTIIEERKDEKHMEVKLTHDSPEYRTAWLNKMRGVPLTDVEERAFTGSAYVVPDSTANKVIDALVDMVPLLNEVELLRVKGNVSFAVQSAAPAPTPAAGGGGLNEATTTLVQVSLGSYTLATLVRIGADIASMAIDAFEGWLTGKIAEQLSYKIEEYIVKGNGSSAPTGIDEISWTDNTNAIDWASTSLADDDIDQAIGLLPAAYDKNAKFLMSKKTFFNNVIGLTDTNNVPIVQREGGKYLIRGYPVLFSDKCDVNDIFFGDFKRGVVANLSNEIKIERDRNLAYNSWDYLGWCSFDCKPSGINCIVKIAADIA